ncbi:hypothetical protein TI39_contig5864g00012 [Zymoseptoria brevis]|uniref:Uncharacterized protein n=1 Tax=Zymoseptoria brevis TaxID=1047168 RepID=A0A0F4G4Y5_9PEZI|nr:hypothetical protein TI39_contig5864g00012 [Zymoseptoria brevis]
MSQTPHSARKTAPRRPLAGAQSQRNTFLAAITTTRPISAPMDPEGGPSIDATSTSMVATVTPEDKARASTHSIRRQTPAVALHDLPVDDSKILVSTAPSLSLHSFPGEYDDRSTEGYPSHSHRTYQARREESHHHERTTRSPRRDSTRNDRTQEDRNMFGGYMGASTRPRNQDDAQYGNVPRRARDEGRRQSTQQGNESRRSRRRGQGDLEASSTPRPSRSSGRDSGGRQRNEHIDIDPFDGSYGGSSRSSRRDRREDEEDDNNPYGRPSRGLGRDNDGRGGGYDEYYGGGYMGGYR